MCTTGRKFYKDSLEKLTYFVSENFYGHFSFVDFRLPLQVMVVGVRFSWGKFKNGEYHPNAAIMENAAVPKFSKPIRLRDSFTQNFSIMISIEINTMKKLRSLIFQRLFNNDLR